MQAHEWMTHLDMSLRAAPGKHAMTAPRADRPGQTAHKILIMGLLLGSLGAGAAATPGYAAGHVTTHDATGAEHIINTPWIY
jgi:hypothetical protein